MTDNINWLDKYKPDKLSDVIGNKNKITLIDKFIKLFCNKKSDEIPNPNLIITGPNGIGKTLIVDLIIKENKFEKVIVDLSNISVNRKNKRKKNIDLQKNIDPIGSCCNKAVSVNRFYNSLKYRNMIVSNDCSNKIALVFDNMSNISNPKEKEAIKKLIKINNTYKFFPIIIIANTKHSKIINDIRKAATYTIKATSRNGKKKNTKTINECVLTAPDPYEIESYIKKICKLENIKLVSKSNDVDNIYSILIEHSQYDIRRLINIMEELKILYGCDMIGSKEILKYMESSMKKDLDPGIYKATEKLLNNYQNIESAITLYSEERATIPLMVHENYPSNIKRQYPKMQIDEQINLMYNISLSMSESDKIDGLIYSNQCWNLQSVHGFYSCVMPSYYINKKENKLCVRESYNYTKDYNRTSTKKINNKVIKKAQENFLLKKVGVYDFLYISSILKNLIANKELNKIAKLMKPYNLSIKEIESIIKIDKVNKQEKQLTGRTRNVLSNLLQN